MVCSIPFARVLLLLLQSAERVKGEVVQAAREEKAEDLGGDSCRFGDYSN